MSKVIPVRIEDVSDYPERTYHYGDGGTVSIGNCRELHITPRSDGKGYAHRVITREKGSRTLTVFYVPPGWVALSYPVAEGKKAWTF